MLKITEIEHIFLSFFRAVCFLERLHGQKQIDDRAGRGGDFFREFLVFRVAGNLARKFHLPQVNDVVTFKSKTGSKDIIVTGLKLHKRQELAKGLFIIGHERDSDDKEQVRLDQVTDISRDIGNDLFSRDRFLSYYTDYRGSR